MSPLFSSLPGVHASEGDAQLRRGETPADSDFSATFDEALERIDGPSVTPHRTDDLPARERAEQARDAAPPVLIHADDVDRGQGELDADPVRFEEESTGDARRPIEGKEIRTRPSADVRTEVLEDRVTPVLSRVDTEELESGEAALLPPTPQPQPSRVGLEPVHGVTPDEPMTPVLDGAPQSTSIEHTGPAASDLAHRPTIADVGIVPAAVEVELASPAAPIPASDRAPRPTDVDGPVGALEPLSPIASESLAEASAADRSMDRLDPTLQRRIDRVVRRMEAEHGHTVELVEGVRSPERQEFLYAQGRTRPGPVVTWTRDSAHSRGRAADLMVDGGYDDAVGYARLQQIAREEGLRTLGMKDRGHVELPAGASDRGESSFELRAERGNVPSGVTPRSGRVGLARVARPAATARVANVARVAQPGGTIRTAAEALPLTPRPIEAPVPDLSIGPSTRAAGATLPSTPRPIEAPVPDLSIGPSMSTTTTEGAGASRVAASSVDGSSASTHPSAPPVEPAVPQQRPVSVSAPQADLAPAQARTPSEDTGSSRDDSRERPDDRKPARPSLSPTESRAAALDLLSRATDGAIRPAGRVEAPSYVDAMDRVERVLEARELARSAAPSSVRVKLDGTAGPIESIRVGLSGREVMANLDVSDPAAAERLRSRVSELTEALQARGMDLGGMGIRSGGTEGLVESLLGARGDATSDLLRTLLGGNNTDNGRETRDERFRQQAQREFNDDRSGSNRSGRDSWKEQQR